MDSTPYIPSALLKKSPMERYFWAPILRLSAIEFTLYLYYRIPLSLRRSKIIFDILAQDWDIKPPLLLFMDQILEKLLLANIGGQIRFKR